MAGLPKHRGLGMAEPVGEEMEDYSSEMEEMGGRQVAPPRRGAPGGQPPQEDQDEDGHDQSFRQWQEDVKRDRQRHPKMSGQDYDRWDMEWRRRAVEAGLDEQEVDAFMDSLWEGEDSEPLR